ncbi:MAG: hypothetical protein KTV16_14695, partial [Acidimicrobiia bacterium]|nr:hypothetical protein [Acidimicrobiia bacterium]
GSLGTRRHAAGRPPHSTIRFARHTAARRRETSAQHDPVRGRVFQHATSILPGTPSQPVRGRVDQQRDRGGSATDSAGQALVRPSVR